MASTGRRMKMSVKFMGGSIYRSIGIGAASAVGVIELSISTDEPLCSLIWPAVTTVSPSLTP